MNNKDMKFQSLKEWISLNEGGEAIPNSRPITWDEAQALYSWIKKLMPSKFGIEPEDLEVIGSYGKKVQGETHGDLDIAVSVDSLVERNGLGKDQVLDFVNDALLSMGFETKKMPGFKQVSAGIPIPGTSDIAQVDFMLSPGLEWSKFVYHSPDFRSGESKYKGVYRNALLMAIITESSKEILKRTPAGDVEELETNVIRYPEGIWRARKSFMGKKGLVKTGQLLRDFDKFVTINPQEVTDLAVGKGYTPNSISTFERLWHIVTRSNFVHSDKLDDILQKFAVNLKSMGIPYPEEAKEKYPEIFNDDQIRESLFINPLFEIGEANMDPYDLEYIDRIKIWRGHNIGGDDIFNSPIKMSGYKFTTEDGDEYLITIVPSGKTKIIDNKFYNIRVDFEVQGKDPNYIVNKGRIFRVLTTVVKAINDYLARNPHIFSIIIMADKDSKDVSQRMNLYKRYISKNLPAGWEINSEIENPENKVDGREIIQLVNRRNYEKYKKLL